MVSKFHLPSFNTFLLRFQGNERRYPGVTSSRMVTVSHSEARRAGDSPLLTTSYLTVAPLAGSASPSVIYLEYSTRYVVVIILSVGVVPLSVTVITVTGGHSELQRGNVQVSRGQPGVTALLRGPL